MHMKVEAKRKTFNRVSALIGFRTTWARCFEVVLYSLAHGHNFSIVYFILIENVLSSINIG